MPGASSPTPPHGPKAGPRYALRRGHRLTHAREYRTVYREGVRRSSGPLTVYAAPNGRPEHRLGLSVGRRVGGAVTRNRIKRLLREAFRLERSTLPRTETGGFDLVATVRAHRAMPLDAYRAAIRNLCMQAAEQLARRSTEGSDHGG